MIKEQFDVMAGWREMTKNDIKYFVEKKCENCGWWWKREFIAFCDSVTRPDGKARLLHDRGDLVTDPDFYCNEWKPKE